MESPAWYGQTAQSVIKTFSTDLMVGLSESEAIQRREVYGTNNFAQEKGSNSIQKFYRHLLNPLVSILLIACITTLFLHDTIDSIVIGLALLINIAIGLIQERRASTAFETLSASQERFATVIRDGNKKVIPAGMLVPGDIVEIRGGSAVPADIRISSASELFVNEAPLTGESLAVAKQSEPVGSPASLSKQLSMIWMGTFVVSGTALGVVTATGEETEMGKIAEALLGTREAQTPIQRNIAHLARFLAWIVVLIVSLLFIIGIIQGQGVEIMFALAIAVAVSVIPEGLSPAVTAVLAIGMEKLLSRGGLVRNMLTAETLGSTTVILTDKTGTLTRAQLSFRNAVTLEIIKDQKGEDSHEVLRNAALAVDVFIEKGTQGDIVRGKPLEKAIVEAALEKDIDVQALWNTYPRLDTILFESKNRFGGSIVHTEDNTATRLCVVGAPEVLLEASHTVYYKGEKLPLGKKDHEELHVAFEQASRDGLRVVAVAWKERAGGHTHEARENTHTHSFLSGLTFGGLLVFEDPIREDVPNAVRQAREAGSRIIMLTGDNMETARAVAREAGIINTDEPVLLGKDIDAMTDEELQSVMSTHHVFARIVPLQKMRIVDILQKQGEIVAMTGDGINDAPALQKAHIGIALGSGTDVAKEASDLILMHDSFSIIVSAIEEGRRIMDNLKKIVTHLLSTSFGEVFVIAGAIFAGTPLPILPAQILWLNIIEEGFLSFAFAFEPVEGDVMKRNPREEEVRTLLTPPVRKVIMLSGTITGILALIVYFVLLSTGWPIEHIRTLMFGALTLDALVFSVSLKNLRGPFWKVNFTNNRYLLGALGINVFLFVLTLLLPPLREFLSLTPLSSVGWIILALVVISDLVIIEAVKYFSFKKTV